MIFKKIKKFTKKVFSSKTYLLIGLNKIIPNHLGSITDITIDREDKNIYLELEQDKKKAQLNILGYGLEYKGDTAYLVFKKIEKTSYLSTMLKDIQQIKKIKVDKKYIKLVEQMI